MVKDALAGPKNNYMTKNEREMGKYSLRYHTHKLSRLYARKMIKAHSWTLKKDVSWSKIA